MRDTLKFQKLELFMARDDGGDGWRIYDNEWNKYAGIWAPMQDIWRDSFLVLKERNGYSQRFT